MHYLLHDLSDKILRFFQVLIHYKYSTAGLIYLVSDHFFLDNSPGRLKSKYRHTWGMSVSWLPLNNHCYLEIEASVNFMEIESGLAFKISYLSPTPQDHSALIAVWDALRAAPRSFRPPCSPP